MLQIFFSNPFSCLSSFNKQVCCKGLYVFITAQLLVLASRLWTQVPECNIFHILYKCINSQLNYSSSRTLQFINIYDNTKISLSLQDYLLNFTKSLKVCFQSLPRKSFIADVFQTLLHSSLFISGT